MDKDNERILFANVIGECIKSLELDKGINQQELALRSGVPLRSLRRIETGQIDVDFCTLVEILTALEEDFAGFYLKVMKNLQVLGRIEGESCIGRR